MRRGDEAGDVRNAAAAERHHDAGAVDGELVPEPARHGEPLRILARRQLVLRGEASAERELRVGAVDAGDVAVGDERYAAVARDQLAEALERPGLHVDAAGGEHDAVQVVCLRHCDLLVHAPAGLVEDAELAIVPGERAPRLADALPRSVDVDVDQHGEVTGELGARRRRQHGAAPERDHRRLGAAQHLRRGALLGLAEHRLAMREHHLDARPRLGLDLAVEIDERAAQPRSHLLAEGRLARAHEANEREVAA